MNKTLLLAGVTACLFATNAMALDLQQYVSVKASYSDMSNEAKTSETYKDGSGSATKKFNLDEKIVGNPSLFALPVGFLRAGIPRRKTI